MEYRWWQFGLGWSITGDRHEADLGWIVMIDNRENALELALGMLLASIDIQGLDAKDFVDHASGLVTKASNHFENDAVGSRVIAELHSAYAQMLASKQRSET